MEILELIGKFSLLIKMRVKIKAQFKDKFLALLISDTTSLMTLTY